MNLLTLLTTPQWLARHCSLNDKPTKAINKLSMRVLKQLPVLALLAVALSPPVSAAPLEKEKMAAVLSVINSYLLSERRPPEMEPIGLRIDIELEDLLVNAQSVSEGSPIYAAFDLQQEGVEFCFDLDITSPGQILVQVNGKTLPAYQGADNCYVIPEHLQREINYVTIAAIGSGANLSVERFGLEISTPYKNQLPVLTRGGWDEQAVRKVLKIFAFGGHARDEQIQDWADMKAELAITEMLNFSEHNLLLSPLAEGEIYTDSASDHGTLEKWAAFMSSEASMLPIPLNRRDTYSVGSSGFDDGYNRMITVRGLNPFRQRIGFWETNYHLAVNLDAGVDREQVARYYDLIMKAHEDGLPYHEVMGIAAKSAAIAEQYGHDRNEWVYDRNLDEYICKCNDDFAREIHQLFYGIFGTTDPHHEDVTIPQTARLLTDMRLENSDGPDDNVVVDFGTDDHHTDPVDVLGVMIAGVDAEAKIDALMPVSIVHPESLENLPVMIVSVLADDNLSESLKNKLRESWASLLASNNNFLQFIQTYAISDLLHGPQHIKYFTSHERALYQANKNNLDNLEAYFGGANYDGRAGRSVGGTINDDNAGEIFRPIHNVFGGQTGLEAADSSLVFENNYNTLTDDEYLMRDIVACEECDFGQPWEKKWRTVLPAREDGKIIVEDVAPWLWNHAVGSMKNYTELERAHLYAMLGSGRYDPEDDDDGSRGHDFNLVMCIAEDYVLKEQATDAPILEILDNQDGSWDDYCNDYGGGYEPHEIALLNRVYTGQDIADSALIQSVLSQLGSVELRLNATTGYDYIKIDGVNTKVPDGGANLRRHELERINSALAFIFTTPFIFAEGQ